MADRTLRLYSTDEAAALAGVTPIHLHRWAVAGAITPHTPAAGTGSKRAWSARDVDRLARIGAVYRHAMTVGIILPNRVIGDIWAGLRHDDAWTLTLSA